ncbi:type III-A CRISPR-associated protein Csm2 [Aliarcobacter lanthieri]|uniref:type III-A CRISPR-associated protein Csm2 n=1 Tax=Aliarcobacter lanthieri TaxID=1355374 RepID=UPI003AAA5777
MFDSKRGNNQNNPQYNRNNQNNKKAFDKDRPQLELPKKIVLDYEKDIQLFGDTAEKWAKKLNADSTRTSNKINQIRSFYDKVLELNEKAQNKSDEDYKKEVYPFIIMLNSKVAYAKTRDLVSDSFVKMINYCVEEANSVKAMNNFKLFFEALIGFYPKK